MILKDPFCELGFKVKLYLIYYICGGYESATIFKCQFVDVFFKAHTIILNSLIETLRKQLPTKTHLMHLKRNPILPLLSPSVINDYREISNHPFIVLTLFELLSNLTFLLSKNGFHAHSGVFKLGQKWIPSTHIAQIGEIRINSLLSSGTSR